jgi:hypothetical protein
MRSDQISDALWLHCALAWPEHRACEMRYRHLGVLLARYRIRQFCEFGLQTSHTCLVLVENLRLLFISFLGRIRNAYLFEYNFKKNSELWAIVTEQFESELKARYPSACGLGIHSHRAAACHHRVLRPCRMLLSRLYRHKGAQGVVDFRGRARAADCQPDCPKRGMTIISDRDRAKDKRALVIIPIPQHATAGSH